MPRRHRSNRDGGRLPPSRRGTRRRRGDRTHARGSPGHDRNARARGLRPRMERDDGRRGHSMIIAAPLATLTVEQRRIVEWGDGPVVVIAGAGTGKTRVIVERVRHLLATHDDLLPEQILVLTYNVKAARELRERLDATLGLTVRARVAVSNFHSFCHRILTENAGDAGLPARPDVLDGVAQVLLLRDILADVPLVYHSRSNWSLGGLVG